VRPLLRTLLAIDLVVLGAGGMALVAGAGDDGDTTGGGPQVAIEAFDPIAAADATLAQTTMRFEQTTSIGGLVPFDTIEVPSSGAIDLVNGRSEIVMDMARMLEQIADAMDEEIPADEMARLGGPMRMIQDGLRLYMCGGMFAAEIDAECAVFDMAAFDPAFAEFAGTPQGAGDPTAMLESLRGASDVVELGREDVRGIPTTHYRGTHTLDDAIEQAPDPDALRNAFIRLGVPESSFDDEEHLEVWVGDDGLVHRMRQTLDNSGYTSGQLDGESVNTMEFFDFGAPIEIVIPTDAVDITQFMGEEFTEIQGQID
jgi:hypothetical protein